MAVGLQVSNAPPVLWRKNQGPVPSPHPKGALDQGFIRGLGFCRVQSRLFGKIWLGCPCLPTIARRLVRLVDIFNQHGNAKHIGLYSAEAASPARVCLLRQLIPMPRLATDIRDAKCVCEIRTSYLTLSKDIGICGSHHIMPWAGDATPRSRGPFEMRERPEQTRSCAYYKTHGCQQGGASGMAWVCTYGVRSTKIAICPGKDWCEDAVKARGLGEWAESPMQGGRAASLFMKTSANCQPPRSTKYKVLVGNTSKQQGTSTFASR